MFLWPKLANVFNYKFTEGAAVFTNCLCQTSYLKKLIFFSKWKTFSAAKVRFPYYIFEVAWFFSYLWLFYLIMCRGSIELNHARKQTNGNKRFLPDSHKTSIKSRVSDISRHLFRSVSLAHLGLYFGSAELHWFSPQNKLYFNL